MGLRVDLARCHLGRRAPQTATFPRFPDKQRTLFIIWHGRPTTFVYYFYSQPVDFGLPFVYARVSYNLDW